MKFLKRVVAKLKANKAKFIAWFTLTKTQPQISHWSADLVNEKNLTLDDLKFVFSQAEKRVDDGIKNFDATTTKSITFITLTATLLSALAAYFFATLDFDGQFDKKLCTVFVCCIYTAWILLRFVTIILPKSYQPIGSRPQELLTDDYFTDENKAHTHEWGGTNTPLMMMYISEIENYNRRIIENADINTIRLKIFNISAKMILLLPVVGLITYSVLVFFPFVPSWLSLCR